LSNQSQLCGDHIYWYYLHLCRKLETISFSSSLIDEHVVVSLGTTLTGVTRYNLNRQWLNLVLSFYSRLGRTTIVVDKLLVVSSSLFYLEIIFRRYVLGLIFTIQMGIMGMHFTAEWQIFCANEALNSAVLYAYNLWVLFKRHIRRQYHVVLSTIHFILCLSNQSFYENLLNS